MLKNSADIMRCPNIVRPSLVIAVAVGYFALFLAPCCLAAAIEAEGLQQELLVPFNDLLPPLSDAELQEVQATSTIATTTTTSATSATTTNTAITVPATTARATVVTEASVRKTATTKAPTKSTTAKAKPTKATTTTTTQKLKKSQYQLDQQSQKQQLAVPILDLNPEVPPALPDVETSTVAPVVSPSVAPSVVPPPSAVLSASPVKVSTEPKQAASTQHFQQVQAAQTQFQTLQHHLQPQKVQQQKQHRQQQQQQQQQQQLKQQLTKSSLQQPQVQHKLQPQAAVTITEEAAPPQPVSQQPQRVNVDQLRQYLEYVYHPTTRRPSRGPLPTLTAFPRHFK